MNSNTMKAVVCTKYGSPEVLKVMDVAKPVPGDNEILIQVMATPVTAADTMLRKADPWVSRLFLGLRRPKKPIIGTGFAGKVIEIGQNVEKYKIGDEVFGETGVNFSANAEYICLVDSGLILPKPQNIPFEEAATFCDGALTSINFLKALAEIKPGQKVLINGASGSLGTAAVQLAKYYGAVVTGVCSTRNLELVKSLGANHVIDYTQTDFTKANNTYDIIFDTVGKKSFAACKKVLEPNGKYLSPVLSFSLLISVLFTALRRGKKAIFSATGLKPIPELRMLLEEISRLTESGLLKTIIDKRYPLVMAVDAHKYVDTGRKKGNVVLTT